ncbi:response regulator [Dyadobacter sp. 676]|uniref:Response regulator n=1 Tax=Dyadobacter sp. 676 TaxID=3088362 RepID=A0AAU8FGF0_9BACT
MQQRNKNVVYLVDDDEDDRMLIRDALENISLGCTIFEFSDGEQLLSRLPAHLEADAPSVILLDINMPRVSGMEALVKLRSNPATSHIPVAIFSTSSDARTIAAAYTAGANAYLVKPVSMSDYQRIACAVTLTYLQADNCLPGEATYKWPQTKPKGVLVIEDNKDHWNLMRPAWSKMPQELKPAHADSASTAMAYLESAYHGAAPPVGLIVLDLYLPDRSQGLQLLSNIRQFYSQRKLALVPIIIFSISEDMEDVRASYRRLASAYIPKSTDLTRSAFRLKNVCMAWLAMIVMPKLA